MGVACGTYGGDTNCLQFRWEKTDGKRPLGITRSRWEDNSKMGLRKWDVGDGMD